MNQVFGLPAHPLLVHVPIVLIPLLALLAIAFVARPAWRPAMSIPLAALAVITLLGTLLAASSGESLRDRVQRTEQVRAHAEQGDQLRVIGALFCLAVLGTVLLENSERRGWRRLRLPAGRQLLVLASAVTIVVAVAATTWDVRAGHSGAKAVWSDPSRFRAESAPVQADAPIAAATAAVAP
jgi:hypothetical protein